MLAASAKTFDLSIRMQADQVLIPSLITYRPITHHRHFDHMPVSFDHLARCRLEEQNENCLHCLGTVLSLIR